MSLTENNTSENSPTEEEPRYITIGFFCHGGYGTEARPYKANPHASTSLTTFTSIPKLMTFINCAPGNVLLGEDSDNTKLINYFERNGDIDLTETHNEKTKNKDKIISENFLKYVKTALKELRIEPRDRTEQYKKRNKTDVDVCRNSFICKNQVGISHTFANKTFSTDFPSENIPFQHWGVFIYNNNCNIPHGTKINRYVKYKDIINEDDDNIGVEFHLSDIISGLTKKYGLTDKDYLFLFDYSCSIFEKSVNPTEDKRKIRNLGRSLFDLQGFKPTRGKRKRSQEGGKKKTRKHRKNNGVRLKGVINNL